MSVHHTRYVELRLSYGRAFDLCIESLCLFKKCKIQNEDRSEGQIVATTDMTWRTWGDVISFEIRRSNGDGIHIEVTSRPAVATTLVDFGQNLENVETIIGFLNTRSGETPNQL